MCNITPNLLCYTYATEYLIIIIRTLGSRCCSLQPNNEIASQEPEEIRYVVNLSGPSGSLVKSLTDGYVLCVKYINETHMYMSTI